jgi:hypothetical protein
MRFRPAILNGFLSSTIAVVVGYHIENWQWWAIVGSALGSYTLGLIAAELSRS